jgi:cytochrome c
MAELTKKIREGGQGVWGNIPMPAQPAVSNAEASLIVNWLLQKK